MDASQKLPRYPISYNYPYRFPAENATFGRKQPVLLPGSLHPTFLVLLRNSLPSSFGFIALCASQIMPQITFENYTDADFYAVISGMAVVFLRPLTVMEISDPSAQVLIPKGKRYFQRVPFRKKKIWFSFVYTWFYGQFKGIQISQCSHKTLERIMATQALGSAVSVRLVR